MKTNINMTRKIKGMAVLIAALGLSLLSVQGEGATRASEAIWAHGELYDTVVTKTAFRVPPGQSTDTIYNFDPAVIGGNQPAGQRSISDAAPGDVGFNGGRWTVKLAVFTEAGIAVHDPDGDGVVNFELTSFEQFAHHVQLGHIEVVDTGIYFECPMLPRR